MHGYANPARFLKIARAVTGWCLWPGLLLVAAGVIGGLFVTPPDYLQGDSARILYVHVPSAWLGMAGWSGLAAAALAQLVWRHPLSTVAGRAIAPAGAMFAFVCLATGSIWGRPTWGTWWEWDGRLTSMLILFFLYLGYIGLAAAERERGSEGRMAALFALVGTINLPIIHFSVKWWRTLHQGESISFVGGGSSIASEMAWPLYLTTLGFTLLFAAIVLMRMRGDLATIRSEIGRAHV